MATKNFTALAQQARQSWSDDAVAVYDAVAASYAADIEARVHLGRMLADARTQRHLTQSELSQVSGVQQAEISKIEGGRGNPTLTTLERLSQQLGVRLALISEQAPAREGKQPA